MTSFPAETPGSALPPAMSGVVAVEAGPQPPVEVTAVPEPSPVFLLVGALALVFLLKRGGNGGS